MRDHMISLPRINRAVDAVRTGRVHVAPCAQRMLHDMYTCAYQTEFFMLSELQLVESIEGEMNGGVR